MKYIMLKTDEETPRAVPIIFPDFMVHSTVSKFMQLYFLRIHEIQVTPVSAGQLNLDVENTYGHSETLKLKSDPKDAEIINTYPYVHGVLE